MKKIFQKPLIWAFEALAICFPNCVQIWKGRDRKTVFCRVRHKKCRAMKLSFYFLFQSRHLLLLLPTPSWNDDFKKIIVQACTMIDLSKWAIWACKITIVQKKSPGLLAPSSVEIFNFWTRRAWRLIFCQNDALMSTSFCQSFSFLTYLWPGWWIKT